MPKFLINPITGEFDLVGDGSGGGGSGTVTAVSGGVGITNVPDPIVGAGSVNLDINDLTAESTLAAGDLFAFVDVSSGTTFADQRKVTFGDITAAIAASGTPMAADCTTAPTLLCLGGRTGATNDPLISTDDFGRITGSSAVLFGDPGFRGLVLSAHTGTQYGPIMRIDLNRDVTDWAGPNVNLNFDNDLDVHPVTVDLGGGPVSLPPLMLFNFVGDSTLFHGPFGRSSTWTITDDSLPLTAAMAAFSPTITNPTGVATDLGLLFEVYQARGRFIADDAACTVTEWIGFQNRPMLETTGAGTLMLSSTTGYQSRLLVSGSGVNVNTRYGFRYSPPEGDPLNSIGDDIAFWAENDMAPAPTGKHRSFYSGGALRQMIHLGPAVFGAQADALGLTNSNVGLEITSNTQVLLLSRLSDTEIAALTSAGGMLFYSSDQDLYQGYEGTTLVNFTTTVA